MRKSEVSSTLTVYHDGQFWVGVVEHVENGMLSVARLVFGAEPSNEEVYTWVLERWTSLRLSAEAEPVGPRVGRLPGNPKRRAREAAKAMRQHGSSTASQLALARERERSKEESRSERAARGREEARVRWEKRHEKRRHRHRGK
ncbi:YjdF family protein [Collinsella intestinalis]|uniref:YjdF family protein n=1 Tax=Collinsella intestinalis TaxID=147207 RepID=UPI0022E4FA33|nr:YjdF family protein [Collinsella intestinalis]